jgi:hypothetical protein
VRENWKKRDAERNVHQPGCGEIKVPAVARCPLGRGPAVEGGSRHGGLLRNNNNNNSLLANMKFGYYSDGFNNAIIDCYSLRSPIQQMASSAYPRPLSLAHGFDEPTCFSLVHFKVQADLLSPRDLHVGLSHARTAFTLSHGHRTSAQL